MSEKMNHTLPESTMPRGTGEMLDSRNSPQWIVDPKNLFKGYRPSRANKDRSKIEFYTEIADKYAAEDEIDLENRQHVHNVVNDEGDFVTYIDTGLYRSDLRSGSEDKRLFVTQTMDKENEEIMSGSTGFVLLDEEALVNLGHPAALGSDVNELGLAA